MKTIGIIGGMSWQSSAVYYQLINEAVQNQLGGHASAKMIMASVNFADIEKCQREGRWDDAGDILHGYAVSLEKGGADVIIMATNTMHKVADRMMKDLSIPFLHIASPTGKALVDAGHKSPLLLATRFTMTDDFYTSRLRQNFGLKPIIPDAKDVESVHKIIYDELCKGEIKSGSKQEYIDIISKGKAAGADAVILGCTEIGLLIRAQDSPLPVFDTTRLHTAAAVQFALSE